jgi:hypothetical protein
VQQRPGSGDIGDTGETGGTVATRTQVEPPQGASKYKASRRAYQDAFVRLDDADTFLVHADGDWWRWRETLSGDRVSVVHQRTGEKRTFSPDELSEVVEPAN